MQHPSPSKLPGLVVAIDGPSGSGKTSTARGVATRLGLALLDTGSLYRAVAWAALQAGTPGDDPRALFDLAHRVDVRVGTDPAQPTISVDGVDVTEAIRQPGISAFVSNVATVQPIRDLLSDQMRAIVADTRRIVVEGRDITTVVCPQAQVRVLLVADPAARVGRRERQLGGAIDHEQATQQVVGRDRRDATVSQFATPASGVSLIDSTYLSLSEVIDRVCGLVPADLLGEIAK